MTFETLNVSLMRNNKCVPWGFSVRQLDAKQFCISLVCFLLVITFLLSFVN